MASEPRVTIGVPVFNGAEYLGATLDSLLAQTYSSFVILIGDNGSTDGTADIARAYAARDPRIRYLRHSRNVGAGRNYSELFRQSETEFFRWNAADDTSDPRLLEVCIEELDRRKDVVLAYPCVVLIDGEGRALGPHDEHLDLPQESPSARFLAVIDQRSSLCNAIYGVARASAVRRTRLFGSYRGSDIIFLTQLALRGKFRELEGVRYYRRLHPRAFKSMSVPDKLRFYNPDREQRIEFRYWRLFGEYLKAAFLEGVPISDRGRLLAGLALRFVRKRRTYWDELVQATRVVRPRHS